MFIMSTMVAGGLLLVLSWFDLCHRRLPNCWVAAFSVAFLAHAYAGGLSWPEFGWHAATALATFGVTLFFFSLGWLGGGDVKLWSSVMLWAGPGLALPAVIVATLGGGVLGIVCWSAQKLLPKLQHTALRTPLRLLSAERGVPYGVALSLAGLLVLWARH